MHFKKLIWIFDIVDQELIKVGKPFIIPPFSVTGPGRHPRNNEWLPYLDCIFPRLGYLVYFVKQHMSEHYHGSIFDNAWCKRSVCSGKPTVTRIKLLKYG